MKKQNIRKIVVTLMLGMMVPLAANAADEDLQLKVDKLTKEVNDLKGVVKKVEDKSIGRWLTIGGEYRFRVDSLHGQTVGYTNAPAFMGALQQDPTFTNFFANPQTQGLLSTTSYSGVAGLTPGSMMGNLMGYLTAPTTSGGQGMTPAQAGAYLQQLGGKAFVPAYKPKNETLYTNKFGLDLHAKATQDVTVNVKLDMYKTFGSQTDTATTGNYFADRVGVFDGTLGHVPSDGQLNVDRAYATWSNIAEQPVWFLVVVLRPTASPAILGSTMSVPVMVELLPCWLIMPLTV